MSDSTPAFVPGLAGVPAARSAVCFLDGDAGKLQYRGYPIEVLAEHCTYEETVCLLLDGELPPRARIDAMRAELAAARVLPAEVVAVLRSLHPAGHPMSALAAGLLALGMVDPGDHVGDLAYRRRTAVRIVGVLPSIVAAWDRIRVGKDVVAPRPEHRHAQSFLHMLSGEEPAELAARIMDVGFVLHAEHTLNASTFACRVVGSTLADPYATTAAAVAALSGPLHGGANEEVLAQLRAIGDEDVTAWAKARLLAKDKIMGFGHRVYKVKDPRAHALQTLAAKLFEKHGTTPIYDVAVALERAMAELVGAKGVYPNVDFYSGIVYEKLGIVHDLFTPIFAISRGAGWMAHLLEQLEDNRIFRPRQVWTGETDRPFVPVDERG